MRDHVHNKQFPGCVAGIFTLIISLLALPVSLLALAFKRLLEHQRQPTRCQECSQRIHILVRCSQCSMAFCCKVCWTRHALAEHPE
jgi:hypothetical protein